MRADICCLLKNRCPHNKANISKEEHQAIKGLREDKTRVVLTADKGVTMVVIDKQDSWTRPFHYSVTPVLTKPSIRTPPPGLGTHSSPNSRTSNNKVDSVALPTAKYTLLVWYPPSSMVS